MNLLLLLLLVVVIEIYCSFIAMQLALFSTFFLHIYMYNIKNLLHVSPINRKTKILNNPESIAVLKLKIKKKQTRRKKGILHTHPHTLRI